ncbi:hypothetical protein RB195_016893 [Necator americanus]|uniref:Ligand-binding domain of nuclear hormone receptor n=1 Tax=Necator americanus TaxID=51031 RepID=A0ABR1C4U1_NECAM
MLPAKQDALRHSRDTVAQKLSAPSMSQVGSTKAFSTLRGKLRKDRSYSRSCSSSRSPTPDHSRREESHSPTTLVDSQLLAKCWDELTHAIPPVISTHAETLPCADTNAFKTIHSTDPYTRPATTFEIISAIAKGQNINRVFDCELDNETQAFAVPRSHRPLLLLTQQLGIALNPNHIFKMAHLGQHDFVFVDNFLYTDFFKQLRSIFTKEIILPTFGEVMGAKSPHLPVLLVSQALIGLHEVTEKMTEYVKQLTTQSKVTPRLLLTRIRIIQEYVDNIYNRRDTLFTNLLPVVFSQPTEVALMANLLAQYNITYSKIITVNTTSVAACAEAKRVQNLYFEQLCAQDNLARLLSTRTHSQSSTASSSRSASLSKLKRAVSPPPPPPPPKASKPAHKKDKSQQSTSSDPLSKLPFALTASSSSTTTKSHTQPREQFNIKSVPSHASNAASTFDCTDAHSAVGPEDGPSKPISLVKDQAMEGRPSWEPSQWEAPSNIICHFCRERHWSSSCSNVPRLSSRMQMNADRGGCFICCGLHSEEECPEKDRKRCKACRSRLHDTSFCYLNSGVENDVEIAQYGLFMDQCKAVAHMVRSSKEGRVSWI